MAPAKLSIAVICSAALAAALGAAWFEAGRQERSGRTALRDRALRFSEALEDAAHQNRVSTLVPWLEPAERTSAQARTALDELAVAPRRRQNLVLAKIRLAQGGRQGQAEYLLTTGEHSGTGATMFVDWIRQPDGTWFLNLVDR